MQDLHEHLILKSLSGTISPEEEQELRAWLDKNPENRREYEAYLKVWKLSPSSKEVNDFQSREEWEKLEARIEGDSASQPLRRELSFLKSRSYAIAASVSFLLVCSLMLHLINFSGSKDLIVHESGERQIHFVLPDGTEVWLNRGSKLSYPEEFEEGERRVQLSGEAFFEVVKDPKKPFIVEADKAAVKVLGTSFNVKAFEQAALTRVYVVSGKVSMYVVEEEEKEVVLSPGDMGVLYKSTASLRVEKVESPNALAWKEKKLVFKKAELKEVVATLGDYFSVDIELANPALLQCRFTSSFEDPKLEEVLEVLQYALNVRISRDGKTVKIEGKGC